jgi:hypothetical protein
VLCGVFSGCGVFIRNGGAGGMLCICFSKIYLHLLTVLPHLIIL